ncbi:hypothetical protein HZS_2462, partial [Henneguya salminicola]
MHHLPKIRENLYIYNAKDPSIFRVESPKEEMLKNIIAYLEQHYIIVSGKENIRMSLQVIGILGISKLLSKNVSKATELLMKQLKMAEDKKIEVEIVKAANNLGVIFHRNGDLLRAYIAFTATASIRSHHRTEFILEIYNLANLLEQLGKIDIALQFYVYCYRWYSCRIPLNEFRIVKILISILDIHMLNNKLEDCTEITDKLIHHIRHLQEIKLSHPFVVETIFQELKISKEEDDKKKETYLDFSRTYSKENDSLKKGAAYSTILYLILDFFLYEK